MGGSPESCQPKILFFLVILLTIILYLIYYLEKRTQARHRSGSLAKMFFPLECLMLCESYRWVRPPPEQGGKPFKRSKYERNAVVVRLIDDERLHLENLGNLGQFLLEEIQQAQPLLLTEQDLHDEVVTAGDHHRRNHTS